MDERYDMMRSVMDGRWLYIRNYRPDLPYVQPLEYMFQARGYQSWARGGREGQLTPATAQFWGQKPTEELYDMDADPDNVNNLAADPAHRETLEADARGACGSACWTIKDNGFLPEGSALEGYDASHTPGAYPDRAGIRAGELGCGQRCGQPAGIDRGARRPKRAGALVGRTGLHDARPKGDCCQGGLAPPLGRSFGRGPGGGRRGTR